MTDGFEYQWDNPDIVGQALHAARSGQLNAEQQHAVVLVLAHLSLGEMVRADMRGGEKAHRHDEWSKAARQALVMAATRPDDVIT